MRKTSPFSHAYLQCLPYVSLCDVTQWSDTEWNCKTYLTVHALLAYQNKHCLLQKAINPLTAGAAYIRVFIFISTLSATF